MEEVRRWQTCPDARQDKEVVVKRKNTALVAAMIGAAALALTGCASGSSSDDGGGTGEDIVIASVNGLSGPVSSPESAEAAQVVFDNYNAEGGLNGRQIRYEVFDDKADPAAASSAARDAVATGAVVMAGSASMLDCEVNNQYYAENGLSSIPGTGVDALCFSSENISPVNPGPFLGTRLALTYGSETLGLEKICTFLAIAGSTEPAYTEQIELWTEETGKEPALLDTSIQYGAADYTPWVVKAKEAGCDGIYFNSAAADAIGMLKAAETQGMDDVAFMFLSAAYSDEVAKAATFVGKGVYLLTEFTPYGVEGVTGTEEYVETMEAAGVALSSLGQGGYLAAKNIISVLESIDGEITAETVSAALRDMSAPIEDPATGQPWKFGELNRTGFPVTLQPGVGAWEAAGDEWVVLSR